MSGRNGTAGRRGGRETAPAPVSDAGEDAASATETARATVRIIADRAKRCDTLDALDALAADAEDAAQYIPEGGDGALAEAVRSEMLAAIDGRRELLAERAAHAETRERCAEALRAARAGVTLAADFEAKRQQAEAEKRGAMETARAVGAKGRRKKRGYNRPELSVEDTVLIANKAGVKTPKGKTITARWIRAVEAGHIKTPSWYHGRNVTAEQMANHAAAEAQRQRERPDVSFALGDRAVAAGEARRARQSLRTGYHG